MYKCALQQLYLWFRFNVTFQADLAVQVLISVRNGTSRWMTPCVSLSRALLNVLIALSLYNKVTKSQLSLRYKTYLNLITMKYHADAQVRMLILESSV